MIRVVLAGGGGVTHGVDAALDEHLMARLPGAPRIGHIGAANDDDPVRIARVSQRFVSLGATVAHLPKDAGSREAVHWAAPLHAIYVGGGNTTQLLAHWRRTGIDHVLMDAARRGVVLSGVSAGAVVWFDVALWDGAGAGYQPLVGLGLLPGSCCPHYTSEPARALAFRAHVAAGLLPDGYAIGDGAALILDGDKPAGAVVGRAQTGVWRISREGATTRQAMVPAATD